MDGDHAHDRRLDDAKIPGIEHHNRNDRTEPDLVGRDQRAFRDESPIPCAAAVIARWRLEK